MKLDHLRQQIDEIDQELISLLAKRFQITEEVGQYKATQSLPAQDPGREARQFKKIEELAVAAGLQPDHAAAIFRCIMDQVISRHEELRRSARVPG
ncbi:chorismate mutase [Paenibacillus silvisoli]|uniref:chorismate mutase n=1 Tax=Paenibacillus silvisoli TaxID=3110539 RepID=UPI002804CCBF|nr:chorismate mutase [Paenibacillus silvisoli]